MITTDSVSILPQASGTGLQIVFGAFNTTAPQTAYNLYSFTDNSGYAAYASPLSQFQFDTTVLGLP